MEAQSASATATSVRRLRRELQLIQQSPNSQVAVKPSSSSLLEWHFALHSLPADTPYSSGCYHDRLLFPANYPHAPPTVVMVTPSGRLEVGCRLCLSMTDFHPESWNPAWSVDTILTGLLSFFLSDSESGYGSVQSSDEQRRQLARSSWAHNATDPDFVQLFPELMEPPERRASTAQGSSQERAAHMQARECWICRDVGSEPLIHPCACRGSMSGVHASCVEQWMRHQRQAGGGGSRPRCSICREAYLGQEVRPGLSSFVFHYASDFGGQLIRSALLVAMLLGFQDCWRGKEAALPLPASIAFILMFGCVILHKFAVLAASLPLHRPPPRSPRAQRFHTSDPQKLARNSAEALTTICVLAVWYMRGELPFVAFLPFGIVGVCFVLKVFSSRLSWSSLCVLTRAVLRCLLLPVMLLRHVTLSLLDPRWVLQLVHPLGAGSHALLVLGTLLLMLCSSNVPLILLWAVHSAALALAIAEKVMAARLVWRHTFAWIYVAQLAFFSMYVANTCCHFQRGFCPDRTWVPVATASALWLTCVCTMALVVNWEECVRHYRNWQRQHGVFTLAHRGEASAEHRRDLPV